MTIICPYCSNEAPLVDGSVIYPHRPDLHSKPFYQCAPCDAYVGCHPGTEKPLGRLANAELRRAKMAAHAAFDPLWRNGKQKRGNAYKWLAEQLGIAKRQCHIGYFDVDTCNRVKIICQEANRG